MSFIAAYSADISPVSRDTLSASHSVQRSTFLDRRFRARSHGSATSVQQHIDVRIVRRTIEREHVHPGDLRLVTGVAGGRRPLGVNLLRIAAGRTPASAPHGATARNPSTRKIGGDLGRRVMERIETANVEPGAISIARCPESLEYESEGLSDAEVDLTRQHAHVMAHVLVGIFH